MCGTVELLAKKAVIRLECAMIELLVLGSGIISGTTIYRLFDPNACADRICKNNLDWRQEFLLVGAFSLCLVLVNQARWRQAPLMVGIGIAGFLVNKFATPQISYFLCGAAIGALGNNFSWAGQGLAMVSVLSAFFFFVQAPGALVPLRSLIAATQGNANSVPTATLGALGWLYFWDSMSWLAFWIAFGLMVSRGCRVAVEYCLGWGGGRLGRRRGGRGSGGGLLG